MEPTNSFDALYNALMIENEDIRIQTLRTLIDNGIDVNSCSNLDDSPMMEFKREGFTVLIVAVRYGYVDCVQLLLDVGANVNHSDFKGGQTALIKAASNGHNECVRILLGSGADVDQSNSNGETALTRAVRHGYDKCVRLLIEAAANVNHSDVFGQTAIIKTAIFGSIECMELLLEAGADVKGVDKNGNTALINCLICFGNMDSKVCLKLLIDAGADIDVRNIFNLQPIHFALTRWQRLTFLAKYLISENCNLNQASYDQVKFCAKDYRSSLKLDQNGRLDMLKLLFACGLPRRLCQSFIVEQETSIRNWVETVTSLTNTLQSICVFEIRKTLGPGIKSKVTKLNLPNVIQNLILLRGILSLECFD